MGFFDDVKNVGLFTAIECAAADMQYKADIALFEARSKRMANNLPLDVDVIDETPKNVCRKVTFNRNSISDTVEDPEEDVQIDDVVEPVENPPAIKDDVEDVDYSIMLGAFNADDLKNNLDDAYVELAELDNRKVKLTILDLLYIGCFIRAEEVYKNMNPENSDDDIVFVNSLNNVLTGLPFNYNKDILNIEDLIDLKDLDEIIKYERTYEKLGYSPEITSAYHVIKELRESKVEKPTSAETKTVSSDGENVIVSPLSFATNSELTQKMAAESKENMSVIKKSEITMLEKKFEGLLDGYNHQFNKMVDLYELAIQRPNGYVESYTIDPGHVFGIGTALIIDRFGSKFPLSVKMKDTCKKVLANSLSANNLTQKEMIEMTKDLMVDYHIYANIDMSRGEEIRSKMSRDEFKKFENILGTILKLPWGKDGRPMLPRTRIRSFKAWNDFILVSDEKVKCPLFAWSNMLISDMTIIVKKDKILIRYGDNEGVVDLTKVA